jgi:hypothetical protein
MDVLPTVSPCLGVFDHFKGFNSRSGFSPPAGTIDGVFAFFLNKVFAAAPEKGAFTTNKITAATKIHKISLIPFITAPLSSTVSAVVLQAFCRRFHPTIGSIVSHSLIVSGSWKWKKGSSKSAYGIRNQEHPALLVFPTESFGQKKYLADMRTAFHQLVRIGRILQGIAGCDHGLDVAPRDQGSDMVMQRFGHRRLFFGASRTQCGTGEGQALEKSRHQGGRGQTLHRLRPAFFSSLAIDPSGVSA